MEVQEVPPVSGGQCQNVQTLKVGRCVKSLWRFFWLLPCSPGSGKQSQQLSMRFWEEVVVWGQESNGIASRWVEEWMNIEHDCWAAQSTHLRFLNVNIKWDFSVKLGVSLTSLLAPCLPQWLGWYLVHSRYPVLPCLWPHFPLIHSSHSSQRGYSKNSMVPLLTFSHTVIFHRLWDKVQTF